MHGLLLDTRLHIFVVAPPGFSKTFWLSQFLEKDVGILDKTPIFTGFEGFMTEAGWVGTIMFQNGLPVVLKGAADVYSTGIVGCEEFSAVVEAMKTQHSRHLDAALLTSLDSGRVLKRLRGGKIDYVTCVTLWSGTQITRFDLTSGMGRRLLFLVFFPSEEDKRRLRIARRKGHGIRYNPVRLSKIRNAIRTKWERAMNNVRTLNFDSSIWKVLDRYNILHFEEPLYERMFLGYTIMKHPVSSNIVVYPEKECVRLVEQEIQWRRMMQRGSMLSHIVSILRRKGGKMPIAALKDELLDFGIDWDTSTDIIERLRRTKVVYIREGFVHLWK